jgi:hypothetical protein
MIKWFKELIPNEDNRFFIISLFIACCSISIIVICDALVKIYGQ